jgi:PAS domain S-box-containing protein
MSPKPVIPSTEPPPPGPHWFTDLVASSHDVFFRYRLLPNPGFDYLSPSAATLTGYPAEAFAADPALFPSIVHPDDRELLERSGSDREPITIRWVHQDGTIIWVQQRSVSILGPDGALVAVEGVARDITAQARALEAVRGSEQAFRGLLDKIDLAAAIVDLDGLVTYVNDYFLAVTGWTRDELMGRDFFEVFAPENQRDQRRNFYGASLRSGTGAAPSLTDFVMRDGTIRQFSLTTTVLHDGQGHPTGIAGIGTDVTAHRAVERERDRLGAAVNQAVESVLVIDADGAVIYANPAAAREAGLEPGDARGSRPYEHLSPRERRGFLKALGRVAKARVPWSGEWKRTDYEGISHREEVTISPVYDGLGTLSSFVVVAHDITNLREAEAEIRSALRERAEIDAALRKIRARATLEETAQAICDELIHLSGIDYATINAFEGPSDLVAIGSAGSPIRVGEYLPRERAAVLRARAEAGPWAEHMLSQHRTDDIGKRLAQAGFLAIAVAPIESAGSPAGLLFVGTKSPEYARHLVNRLPAVVEFATTAQALLGPGLQARRDEVELRFGLEEVVATEAFHPVYQPVVDLDTGEFIGYEALTRFDDGTAPDKVFEAARRTGLGDLFEAATLAASLREAEQLPVGTWVSLNVSPRFAVGGRLPMILGQRTRPVVLEITEHETVEDYQVLREAVAAMGADVRIAVDDAGSGIANFNHLVEMRPAFIKLDISLIRGVNADLTRQALIVGLGHFARTIGHTIIAEGVETRAERTTLKALDIHYGQGYLLGRPAEVSTWKLPTGRGRRHLRLA